jgi:RNA-directed DNA polymerase
LHESLNIIQKAKEQVAKWLHDMGLELQDSKTRISHTLYNIGDQQAGFDFLGFNIRQYAVSKNATKGGYGFKTLIKPSKKALQTHLEIIKATLRKMRGATQEAVIRELNPIITGWSRYYCTSVARKTFETADHETHKKLWRWARFRHNHKGKKWIKRQYFRSHGGFQWRFQTQNGKFLMLHRDHSIVRHTKVKGRMSPYDGNWTYWATRLGKNPLISPRVAKLLKRQSGKCTQCKLYFDTGSILEVHHVDHNHKNNLENNLQLVHGHCHDALHGQGRNVNP